MPSKKAKKIVTSKVAKTHSYHKKNISDWKKLFIAVGLSIMLVIPLTALAQSATHAVLGIATEMGK